MSADTTETREDKMTNRLKIGTSVIAFLVLVAFAYWLNFLGTQLFEEVSARQYFKVAALPSVGVLVTNTAACTLAPILLLCAYFLREKSIAGDTGMAGFFLNLLGILIGGAVGWGLGVFLVPFEEADGAIYSRIGAGVAAFLSGFVVSYVHPLVQSQLDSRRQAFLVQVGLGVTALLVIGLAVTTNRTEYLEYARLERADQSETEAREKAEIEAIKGKYALEYARIKAQRLKEHTDRAMQVMDSLRRRTCTLAR
jgi:hypothetical protein